MINFGSIFVLFFDVDVDGGVDELFVLLNTYRRHNPNALPVPCIHRFMFLGVALGVASCALLGGSKTVLEANMAPAWVDFVAMLGII